MEHDEIKKKNEEVRILFIKIINNFISVIVNVTNKDQVCHSQIKTWFIIIDQNGTLNLNAVQLFKH